jgi:hypothetical protein
LGVGAALGAISVLAAIKVPALLTDYIPYYAATELLLVVQSNKDTHTAEDLARTFGSYFGGAVLGLPGDLGNVFTTNLESGEGLWDIVAPNNNSITHHPSLAATNHPAIHAADGKVNFGVYVAYTVLTSLYAGGKAGEYISDQVIRLMRKTVELDNNQSHAAGSAQDGTGRLVLDREAIQQISTMFGAFRAAQREQETRAYSQGRFAEIVEPAASRSAGRALPGEPSSSGTADDRRQQPSAPSPLAGTSGESPPQQRVASPAAEDSPQQRVASPAAEDSPRQRVPRPSVVLPQPHERSRGRSR